MPTLHLLRIMQNEKNQNNPEEQKKIPKVIRTFKDDARGVLKSGGNLISSKLSQMKESESLKKQKKDLLFELSKISEEEKKIKEKQLSLEKETPKLGMDNKSKELNLVEKNKLEKKKSELEKKKLLLQQNALKVGKNLNEKKEKRNLKNIFILILIIIIFGVGLSFLIGTYIINTTSPETSPELEQQPRILNTDIEIPIDVSEGITSLVSFIKGPKKDNVFSEIVPYTVTSEGEKIAIPASYFAEKLGASKNLSSILDDYFFFGLEAKNGEKNLIMIFTFDQYSIVFSEFLEWEKVLPSTVSSLLGEDPPTPIIRDDLFSTGFVDETIVNKDFRVFEDINNEVKLIYGFFDISTVVVSTNKPTILEIFRILRSKG